MALISFAVTAKLICAFVFAYADCWFSHGAAHILELAQCCFAGALWPSGTLRDFGVRGSMFNTLSTLTM